MPGFAIQPPVVATIAIFGSDKVFPVCRVYCIGRNYAAHAVETGHGPDRAARFFSQKNPDNLPSSGEFRYPPLYSDTHHEAELAVMFCSGGTNIPVDQPLVHVFGCALSYDTTCRNPPGEQRRLARPWEIGKASATGRFGAPGILRR